MTRQAWPTLLGLALLALAGCADASRSAPAAEQAASPAPGSVTPRMGGYFSGSLGYSSVRAR